MVFCENFIFHFKRLKKSYTGGFLIITALIFPIIFILIGMLIDIARWLHCNSALKQAANSAIFASSVPLADAVSKKNFLSTDNSFKLLKENIKGYLLRHFKENLKHDFTEEEIEGIIKNTIVSIKKNIIKSSYSIILSSSYNFSLNPFLFYVSPINLRQWLVNAISEGETISTRDMPREGLSLQFIVDRSSSMNSYSLSNGRIANCFSTPIYSYDHQDIPESLLNKFGVFSKDESLTDSDRVMSCDSSLYKLIYKNDNSVVKKKLVDIAEYSVQKRYLVRDALSSIIDTITKLDDHENKVRMSSIFFDYNNIISKFDWGVDSFKKSIVNNFNIDYNSGTNIYNAIKSARDLILDSQEDHLHESKNNINVRKYIILLTDGANSFNNDNEVIEVCNDIKSHGVKIMTIAFSVPDSQQSRANNLLRQCASPHSFFKADDSAMLNSVFRDRIGKDIFKRIIKLKR
ncbi:VWA domain-containing protein [Candidatus Liberibacter brunswickensis]|uniref:VWA domain-containing protein n=1 Tax=Candidatus Liberibacter brunswickensis TaxID=1968796 RepID=UPI002FE0C46A